MGINSDKMCRFLRLRLFVVTLFILFWCLIKPKEIEEMYRLADEAMCKNRHKELIAKFKDRGW